MSVPAFNAHGVWAIYRFEMARAFRTPLQSFLTVTLPAVMPGVITGALLMFVLAFNEFIVSLLLTNARIVTLPVLIYNSIRSVITPDLAAVSVVYILVAAVAIWLLDKLVGLDIFLRSK